MDAHSGFRIVRINYGVRSVGEMEILDLGDLRTRWSRFDTRPGTPAGGAMGPRGRSVALTIGNEVLCVKMGSHDQTLKPAAHLLGAVAFDQVHPCGG